MYLLFGPNRYFMETFLSRNLSIANMKVESGVYGDIGQS